MSDDSTIVSHRLFSSFLPMISIRSTTSFSSFIIKLLLIHLIAFSFCFPMLSCVDSHIAMRRQHQQDVVVVVVIVVPVGPLCYDRSSLIYEPFVRFGWRWIIRDHFAPTSARSIGISVHFVVELFFCFMSDFNYNLISGIGQICMIC